MKNSLFIILFGFLGLIASGQSSTTYDVEFSRICLIDSIAPDTMPQIWLYTHSNSPGAFRQYFTFDLSQAYQPTGKFLPCCRCLTIASDGIGLSLPPDGEYSAWASGYYAHTRWLLWGLAIFAGLLFFIMKKPAK